MIKVGIVGGTGYTGVELLRLLASHPNVEVSAITSRKEAGTKVADMFPSLRGVYDLAFVGPAEARLGACNVVFFATPHGVECTALFALGFGLTVGLAGVAGDLAESLLKRDAGLKDAGQSIPGFGGVLDVLDSVLFAAPVAYVWFVI